MPALKDTAIDISRLVKHYRDRKTGEKRKALESVDLKVPRGAFYGLLGPNGAGKSTLINIIAGLTIKTAGKVSVNGIDLDENPRGVRQSVGVVPQELVLDPFFTIRETLEFHAGYYGVPKAQRRTDAIMEALQLTDKSALHSRQLSGGMKRRVLIAKALVHSPPILILDEPTAGVDVDLRLQLWDYVRTLNRQGTTVLLTTHYLEEAEELCDMVAIINRGQIIATDTTKNLVKLIDRKHVTFSFEQVLKTVPKIFQAFDPVLVDDHSLTLCYHRSKTSMEELLTLAKKSKLTLRDLSTKEPDLEDTFRYLVSEQKG